MTLTATATPLKSNAYVVTSNRGVDEWGVYFEFVELDSTLSILQRYARVFVARNHVSFYERKAGTARTTWKPFTKASPEEARAYAEKLLTRRTNNVMRGSAILVQLEPSDLETIDKGKSPAARYRATARHQAVFGTLEERQDAKPQGFDYSGIAKAIEAIGTPVATVAPVAPVSTFGAPPSGPAATLPPPTAPVADAVVTTTTTPNKSTPLDSPIDWSTVTDQEPY
jgi:hypothetical protein